MQDSNILSTSICVDKKSLMEEPTRQTYTSPLYIEMTICQEKGCIKIMKKLRICDKCGKKYDHSRVANCLQLYRCCQNRCPQPLGYYNLCQHCIGSFIDFLNNEELILR